MSSSQPITKPPVERTFYAAVIILCIAALVQVAAAVIALVPRIDIDKLGRTFAAHPAVAPAPASSAATPVPAIDPAVVAKANALLDEGTKFRQAGNFQGAVEAVAEADRLVPGKPGILLQMASDQAMLGHKPEAIATLQKIVALPVGSDSLDAGYAAQAKSALTQLGVNPAAPPPAAAQSSTARPAAATAVDSTPAAADVGIPIGSIMGIVECRLMDAEPGQKNLRVATKAASNATIDPQKVYATVDFYEQDDNAQIVHNDAPRPSEWLSGPDIDWANKQPEIFQTKYRMPLEDRGDLPPLQYYGYVVAIYYDGELQDQRADPPSLLNQYAPPLHKDTPTE